MCVCLHRWAIIFQRKFGGIGALKCCYHSYLTNHGSRLNGESSAVMLFWLDCFVLFCRKDSCITVAHIIGK